MPRRNGIKMIAQLLTAVCGVLLLMAAPAAAEPAKVVFILDASGSMWGQIDGKAKIVIAKEVLNNLIDGLPQDMQVGLFAYGHRSKGDCQDIEMLVPVGAVDRKAMKAKIAALNAKGKTPLSASVQQAAKALRYTEEKATVILVSDGLETCDADPCKLAAELAMSGVDFTVHVVGFDITKEEQARLRCLADKTGGLFLAADNARSLADALTQTVAKTEEPPKPIVDDPGTAKLKAPPSVPAGSEFEVEWEGPDSRNDYIAIAFKAKGQTERHANEYSDYAYTEKGNPARLTAPGDPGDYELRYIHAQTRKVIGYADIKVVAVQASLQPPASAPAAGEFEVAWKGPDYEGDYVTVARQEHAAATYEHYTYTRRGNPAKLQAPSDPGNYEIRYILANDSKVLAKVPIVIEKADAQVQFSESADAASDIEVNWQGPDNKGDYISIALPAEAGGVYKTYTYTQRGNPAKLRAPSDPGQYEVRYIQGQGNKILARTTFTVQAVSASVQPPVSAPAGANFSVEWQGPSAQGDYISVAPAQMAAGQYDNYAYTRTGNPVTLHAPSDPGAYEVRYILGQGGKLLAKASISVTPVSANVKAPAEVAAAAKFLVEWQGPGYSGDRVTIAEPKAAGGTYASYFYTKTGTPGSLTAPAKPGIYEVRYIMDRGKKILGRTSITVK